MAIFDCDGTLADTLPYLRGLFNELADAHGFRRVEPHEYEHFRNLHGRALLRELNLPLWKLPRVVTEARRRMAGHAGTFSLFPEVSDVLRRLSQAGIQLAIVSSNSRENVERVLGSENVAFLAHLGCGVSMFGKAARLRQALRQCAVRPADAIYIGDEIRDAEAAAKVGMAFGAATWGHHSTALLAAQKPAELFSSVREIGDKLLECGDLSPL